MDGFHPTIGTVNTGLAGGQAFRAARAMGESGLRRSPARPTMSAAMITLSLLAHGSAVLLLVLLLRGRIEPPSLPAEATVALLFEPAPAAPPATAAIAAAPPERNQADAPAPPVVPQPLSPPAPAAARETPLIPPPPATPPPRRPAAARAARQPALPLAAAEAPIALASPDASAPLVPPRPVAGIATNRAPAYPEVARRRGEQGRVMLRVSVSADGTPLDVALAETSGHASLDSAALAAVRQWRFIPATQAGKSVPAIAEIPVRFRLDN